MQFTNTVPLEETEAVYYAETVTIDGGGCDLRLFGETYSASFHDQDVVDIALAVLEEEFRHTKEQVDQITSLNNFTVESLEDLGFAYLRASQIARELQKRPASLEPAVA